MTQFERASLERTCHILGDLIGFPTVSSDSNLDMMAYMADLLEAVGARVEIFGDKTGAKANLFATLGPDEDGGIVLSGHSDVVPVEDQIWSHDPFEMIEADGKLFGRGACDMKGFIAASLATAETLKATELKRPLHFAFTYDEEVGCLGARAMMPELQRRGYAPSIAIVGEPTEMRVIEGHKGCCEYTTTFSGLAGHSSAPDLGVNAVEYAARYVMKLIDLREEMKIRAPKDSPFLPPWTTVNVGGLRGGLAHNVIASKAEVDWEFRPINRSDFDCFKSEMAAYAQDVLLPEMRKVHSEAEISVQEVGEVDGFEPMDDNAAKDLVMELTGTEDAGLVSFCTEAGLFQSMGMSVSVCGPGSIQQAHKADEFVSLDQLSACLDMLNGIAKKITG